jgi:hypothetical protein
MQPLLTVKLWLFSRLMIEDFKVLFPGVNPEQVLYDYIEY